MTVISAALRASLEAKIVQLEALLEKAYTAYEASLDSGKKSFKFDSGEGMQAVVKWTAKEHRDNIEYLESRIARLERRLNGGLIVNLNVRRKLGGRFVRR